MSKEKRRSDRPPPGEPAIALWVLIPVIIFGAYAMQIFESFSAVGCEGDCDLELALGGRAAYPWEAGASVVVAIVLALVLRFRGKPPHWASLVGVANDCTTGSQPPAHGWIEIAPHGRQLGPGKRLRMPRPSA